MFFKKKMNVYIINRIEPPVVHENMVHVDYSYWDINGKRHYSRVCVIIGNDSKEESVHCCIIKDINTKFSNDNVSKLQEILNKEYKFQ